MVESNKTYKMEFAVKLNKKYQKNFSFLLLLKQEFNIIVT